MAAGTIAVMDRCMAATIEYTSQRKAFGKSILDNQYVHYKLAELQTEVRFFMGAGGARNSACQCSIVGL